MCVCVCACVSVHFDCAGQVYLERSVLDARTDVTVMPIPPSAAGIVSGNKGSNLRSLEQQFDVVLFYWRVSLPVTQHTLDDKRVSQGG